MDRREFLSKVGISAGALALASCVGACSKSDTSAPANVNFTLDLNQSAYAGLKNNGGYVVYSGVIVARTLTGDYIAVSAACTHEGQNVQYVGSGNYFYCSRHGARFGNTGNVIQGPATSSLTRYNTALSGTNLRVYS